MGYLFTSESVSEGHPDKVADQISDAVLDKLLAYDPNSKVACETLVTTGQVVIAGEVKTSAYVDLQLIAREVINKIGYTKSEYMFEGNSCGHSRRNRKRYRCRIPYLLHRCSCQFKANYHDHCRHGKTRQIFISGMAIGMIFIRRLLRQLKTDECYNSAGCIGQVIHSIRRNGYGGGQGSHRDL